MRMRLIKYLTGRLLSMATTLTYHEMLGVARDPVRSCS